MKKVIRCLGCDKVKRYYGAYTVVLTERINRFPGEIIETDVKGKICKDCAKEAGYKMKGGDKK